ncbi:MAG: SgcJ/EcaC family oxidoreductase [Pirellulales bacterium]
MRRVATWSLFVVALTTWFVPPIDRAWAEDKPAAPKVSECKTELDAIRAESQRFVEAFNKRDAKTVADCWTERGEFVDDAGEKFEGRAAIAETYARRFKENPKSTIRIVIDSLRLLGETLAVEEGHTFIEPAP